MAALCLGLSSCIYIPEEPEVPTPEDPFVMTLECARQGTIMASFTCRIAGGHRTFVQGGFYYGTTPSLSDAERVPSIVVDGVMTGSVSGLALDKVYYVKAFVTDKEGTEESQVVTFDSASFDVKGVDHHISHEGGEFTVTVSSNVDYLFDFGHNDWIKSIVTKNETLEYTFSVARNESLYPRSATITAKSLDGYLHQEITILQDEAPITITDDGFKQYLLSRLDGNKSGEIEIYEVAGVTEMDICTDNIESISELGFFPDLTSIVLKGSAPGKGKLKSVDLSACRGLKTLVISNNPITGVDLSVNPSVTYLDISGNSFKSIDLTSMPLLETFICNDNNLESIDLSQNHSLKTLKCERNGLKELTGNVSTALVDLVCDDNALKSIDLSNNRGLISLSCERNSIDDLVLSANTLLETLHCCGNLLTELYLRRNVVVKEVICDDNPIEYFAFGEPAALKKLSCRNTNVSNLDLTIFPNIEYVDVTGTQIKMLDVSECPKLKDFFCCSDYLSLLYIVSSQRIAGITPSRSADHVSASTSIFSRDVEAKIEDANFRAYLIKYFDNDKNGLLTIDECEQIEYVQVSTDNIKSLKGIEYFSNLKSLQCTGSVASDGSPKGLLTSIDVSKNGFLEHFVCSSNHLTSLNVSNNTRLKTLWCYNNSLTKLDLSKNVALVELNCELNQIRELDLTKCPSLSTLDCSPMLSAAGANVLQTVRLGKVRIPYINDLALRRNSSNIPAATKLVFEGIPGPAFLINYNACNYDASTGTFLKEEFAGYNQDLKLNRKADKSGNHVSIGRNTTAAISFEKSIDNPFNRYNLGSNAITVIFKVKPESESRGSIISCTDAENVNFDIISGGTSQTSFSLYSDDAEPVSSVHAYSSPNIVAVRSTGDGQTSMVSYTDNVYSSSVNTSWGGVAKNLALFCNMNNGSLWAGDFYWIYVSLEELTDDEIASVIEYNENMK